MNVKMITNELLVELLNDKVWSRESEIEHNMELFKRLKIKIILVT